MHSNESAPVPQERWGETAPAERLALSRTLLAIMEDGVFFADDSLRVSYANPSFVRSSGIELIETRAPTLDDIYTGPMNDRPLANARAALGSIGYWSGELVRTAGDGRLRTDQLRIAAAELPREREGAPSSRYVGTVRDITDQREAVERLAWTRNHDELTGLPNRSLFAAAVDSVIKRNDGTDACLVLVTADIDEFKRYNTDYGHDTGDRILQAVGKRVASTVRAGDISARTAGDEFSVLMQVRAPSEAPEAAIRVREAFRDAIAIDDHAFPIRASLGVALWPQDGDDASTLLQAADIAMQACKDGGRDGIQLFKPEFYQNRCGRTTMEADLKSAIDLGLLSVHYQPIVRVSTGGVESVEALVRWKDPLRGEVAPDSFIPLAEETGLIVRLGELVLRSACNQGGLWSRTDKSSVRIAVNVSPMQLERPEFPDLMASVLASAGLQPERLIVEITESVLLERLDQAAAGLARLKALGVAISVDDFGTGYSSLSYLKNLPIDIIKIDMEFVRDIEASVAAREIVSGIVGLAHRMGLSVIAEGVETAEQFYLLKSMGCDHAQGFLFSQALPAPELEGRYLVRGGGSRFSTFLLRR